MPELEFTVKVVAHPLVVAVALGLLAPTALATEDRKDRTDDEVRTAVEPAPEVENFEIRGELSETELPEVVYLTLD
ncbi:MAG: hypothetical protein EP330_24310 [Deltaproteobacteria bacterium]|nr:MAG: hypothetical protein EP330_24310 [Deltaproteobacteria bacterium]